MSSHNMFTPRFPDLPGVVPVFPLPGAIVAPGTQLPLNVFEPRYLRMVDDSLGDTRIIGMIQPDPQGGDPERLSRIGCAGRITSFSETDDGRYIVLLSGLCRFETVEEVAAEGGYRRMQVDWSRFESDYDLEQTFNDDGRRDALIEDVGRFAAHRNATLDLEGLGKLDDLMLVNVLICGLGFDPPDAQGLIESVDLDERAQLLSRLLQFRLHDSGLSSSVAH